MFILVTNDDGIWAPGLLALATELARRHRVLVASPDRERSACGHAVSLYEPVHVQRASLSGLNSVPAWSVSGTPADCVKLGVGALSGEQPDLVISGINAGANLATDVFYSGTVSAAIEGLIQGIPAIAVSLALGEKQPDYVPLASYVASLVESFPVDDWPPQTMFNVNGPAAAQEDIAGVALTRMGVAVASDRFERRVDPRGRTYFWLRAERTVDGWNPDSDVMALRRNLISVTAMKIDLSASDDCGLVNGIVLPPLPWEQGGSGHGARTGV